jgi:hypothetical protein
MENAPSPGGGVGFFSAEEDSNKMLKKGQKN